MEAPAPGGGGRIQVGWAPFPNEKGAYSLARLQSLCETCWDWLKGAWGFGLGLCFKGVNRFLLSHLNSVKKLLS